MGVLVNGVWRSDDAPLADKSGRFVRTDSVFRSWVTADGSPGPSGEGGFKAEAGRYHLYIAVTCPWAHRTRIFRILKKLEDVVGQSIVAPRRSGQGWVFDNDTDEHKDHVYGVDALHKLYTMADPSCSGRVTVPVLWDKERETIVNNESSEIIRMFNSAFDGITGDETDFYPAELREEIDAINALTYEKVNNGVYRAGFATTQDAYDEAVTDVFDALDELEERLATRRYLAGDRQTEADWRLFPTLVRFDVAYVGAFKCNIRRLVDYPNLWAYTRDLYATPGVAGTVEPETFKRGYYSISELRNPLGIVPKGPIIDFTEPHGREAMTREAA